MGEKKIKEKQSRFSHLFLITKDTANLSLANNPIQQTDTFPTTSRCIAKVQGIHKCYIRSLFAL